MSGHWTDTFSFVTGAVRFSDPTPGTCYHLSVADGVLWSIGAKDILAFDGQKWTRID